MPFTLLIVNNDRHARVQTAAWLEADGYICVATDTGGALTQAREQKPDAVVIAITHVDDGGMWVVRRLCAGPQALGVIVTTEARDLDVASVATRLGVVDCLSGPPAATQLVDAVRRAMLWRAAVTAATERDQRPDTNMPVASGPPMQAIDTIDAGSAEAMLLAAVEAHGAVTYHRAHRVAESAVALARTCHLSAAETLDVWRAALLHTVGRIAPPGQLSGESGPHFGMPRDGRRAHAVRCLTSLASVPALVPAARLVASIGERVDGTGSPSALMGEAIPAGARVLAVAAFYHDLMPAQSHTPASHDDAIAHMVRSAGTHLDPDMVRAWIGLEDEVARCS